MFKYEDEFPPEEELMYIIKSKQISDKLSKVKGLLEKHQGNLNFDYQEPKSGNTALHFAVIIKDFELINVLLEYGHPENKIKNNQLKTALDIAQELNIKLLANQSANNNGVKPEVRILRSSSEESRRDLVESHDEVSVKLRLEEFVKHFFKAFDEILIAYLLVFEGKIKNAGQFSDTFSSQVPQVMGSEIGGLLLGLPIAATIAETKVGSLQGGGIGDYADERKYGNTIIKLANLVYSSEEDKLRTRRAVIVSGVDIFLSFEMQFMRVNTDQGHEGAMRNLAQDAVNRAISFYEKETDAVITEAVVRGKSKPKFKKSGFEIEFKDASWNTASLYERVGIVCIDESEKVFFEKNKNGKSKKYGFRRLFRSEDWGVLKKEYHRIEFSDNEFTRYNYVLDAQNLKQLAEGLIKIINSDKKDFEKDTIIDAMKEVQCEVLKHYQMLEKVDDGRTEHDNRVLSNIQANLRIFNVDECKQMMINHFKTSELNREDSAEGIEKKWAFFHTLREGPSRVISEVETVRERRKDFSLEKWWPVRQSLPDSFVERKGGRGELVADQIHQMIQKGKSDGVIIMQKAPVTGLGGIGKTTTAKWYTNKYEHEYANIFWINADGPVLRNSFMNLADTLNVPTLLNDNQTEKPLVQIVKELYLKIEGKCKQKCLFVFDNVEEYGDIKYLIPPGQTRSKCNSLIVLRNQNLGIGQDLSSPSFTNIELGFFLEEEAIKFIKGTLGDKTTDDDARTLSVELGYLPLALQQAVAYIKASGEGFGIKEYLEEYEKEKESVTDEDSEKIMRSCLKVTINKISSSYNGRLAVEILNAMAYMHPDHIPSHLFLELFKSENGLSKAIELIKQYSMIIVGSENNDFMNIHRFVQLVIRTDLRRNGKEKDSVETVVNLLNQAVERNKGHRNPFQQHLHEAFKYNKEKASDGAKPDAKSLTEVNKNLFQILGPDKLESIAVTINQGEKLYKVGNYKDALTCFEQVYRNMTDSLGKDHPHTLVALLNVSLALFGTGIKPVDKEKVALSLKFAEECCEGLSRVSSKVHSNTFITALLHKANVLSQLERYDEALKLAREVYDERKKTLLESDPNLIKVSHLLNQIMHRFMTWSNESEIFIASTYRPEFNDKALHLAVKEKSLNIAEYLIDSQGADILSMKHVIIKTEGSSDEDTRWDHRLVSVLHNAVLGNQVDIVKLILEKIKQKFGQHLDHYMNPRDSLGNTPLMFAVEQGNADMVTILLEYGALVNLKNNCGFTALHLAVKNQSESKILELLLKYYVYPKENSSSP